jgi:hypothetical protein
MTRISSLLVQGVQNLLDIIAALLGTYYSKKYAAIVRRLGLPRVTTSKRRGFIIIQVDGLAYTHLKAGMDLGYAPYMQRLLRHDEFVLRPWRTGLPCTTPAAQAGIMFGNNEDIPAFRWYDKPSGESIVCKVPGTIKAIQDRISVGRRGILTGGSSYMNMFDGDASLSMFTLGAMNRKRLFESVRGLGFVLLFILNPFRTLKTFALALWEYLTDLAQHTSAVLRKQQPRPLDRGFPFLRVMSNVVFREIQTFAVMVDIYRGVPAIYTTYYGYDELSHNYGPLSKVPLRALHAIDTRIRQIDGLRRLALTREYDLYVLSDHGQTAAVPFQRAYGKTLGEVIRDLTGGRARFHESSGSEQQGALQAIYLVEELAAIETNVGPRLAHIPRKIRKLVEERVTLNGEEDGWDPLRRTDVVVRNSGSLSHVYFNVRSKQMNISDIAAFFPNLMSDLASHPGIWLVIGREGDQVVIMSQDGLITLDHAWHVEGRNPLAALSAPRLVAAQLRRMTLFPHAGDLVLIGSYDSAHEVVACFEPLWGCHGGLGGPQEMAFMVMSSSINWDLDRVTQATHLYPLFARRYDILAPTLHPSTLSAK